jgi:hypothetical protein
MTPRTREAILERIENAKEPDRVLDAEIAMALEGWSLWKSKHGYWNLERHREHVRTLEGRPPDVVYDSTTGAKLPAELPPMHWADDVDLPTYTESIDAALGLVERVFPDGLVLLTNDHNGHPSWQATLRPNAPVDLHRGFAPTPALALIAALLYALKDATS